MASTTAEAGTPVPAIRFSGVSKRFGGTIALHDVSFDVARGSVHALLGGNGSGKSTLIKILDGVYRADAGWIDVDGQRHAAAHTTPEWARSLHVHSVHQGIGVFPEMSVADNFALIHGYGSRALAPIKARRLNRVVKKKLERFELDLSPKTPMTDLPRAVQTMVAVARAMPDEDEARAVLVLDEPTAALPAHEVHMLLDAIRWYRNRGHTVILVTHRLDEVVAVADHVTFLRDGRHLETTSADKVDIGLMGQRIAGIDYAPVRRSVPAGVKRSRIEVRDLKAGRLDGVSLRVGEGEIVGLTGLQGSGYSSLLLCLFGAEKPHAGEMLFDGSRIRLRDTADAVRRGIGYVPPDRPREGAFMDRSLRENLSAPRLDRYWRGLWLRRGDEARAAREVVRNYDVVASSIEAPMSTMSGGNQQKVVIARWLELRPRVLLLDEPTQGVDVGARAAIHALIREAAEGHGTSVVVASSDPAELPELCDRVVGIYAGRVSGELTGDQLTSHRCVQLANGGENGNGMTREAADVESETDTGEEEIGA